MIRRGLRIDDDSDTEVKEERVTLDANRKRDAFEKDMDNFLFGGPPVRRRQQKKQEPQKKTQVPPSVKQQPLAVKKPETQTPKKAQSEIINRVIIQKQTPVQKAFDVSSSQINKSRTQVNPAKQSQNASLKGSKVSKLAESTVKANKTQIETMIMGQRQMSQIFRQIESSRPNYIRKLKHATEIDTFAQQNPKHHRFIDVVRPIECSKNYIKKINSHNFRDKEFPPTNNSLGSQLQEYQVEWKRYEQSVNHATLGKYIDPNDIKKGKFSSNKFISTLSVLAEREENIKRLIEDQIFNNSLGAYFVRLFINSVWRYYALDTYMPHSQHTNGNAMSYNDIQSDMWVALVQKAYSKAFNGYDVFTRPQPREYYFRDLTGAPTSNYRIDNPEILNIVKKAIENKKIVAAILKSNVSNLGVNPNCTLAVLGTNKKGGLTLRYSWPLIQEKASIPISKEGIFDLSDTQLIEYLSYITIANINRSYFTTTIQTRHEKQFYVAYKVVIKQQIHGYFTVSQLDERMLPREAYIYEPARIFIQKKTDENKFEFISGGFSHMSRNLDIEVNLTPGEYQIFAFVNWNYHVYDFNLTFYGSKQVEFVKIPTIRNHNIISLGLQNYNLLHGKRSALGHVHQFITYHQQTNQILITITNTSAKNYTYVHDLNKINFQSLHLMNLTNNQHDALQNLTKEELQNYKLQAMNNRKWEVQLGPQEIFTWIISTSENYDTNNFKNWGFR